MTHNPKFSWYDGNANSDAFLSATSLYAPSSQPGKMTNPLASCSATRRLAKPHNQPDQHRGAPAGNPEIPGRLLIKQKPRPKLPGLFLGVALKAPAEKDDQRT